MKTKLMTLNLTRLELRTLLSTINTPMWISIVSNTEVKMRKTGNNYLGVRKVSEKYRIQIGFDYENSVNGRLEKEGKETDFVSKPNWFEVISKSLVTDRKTGEKFYLRYQYCKDSTLTSKYELSGDPIEKHLFESFMTERSNYENQGLDNPLQFQVCDLNNLNEISVNGYHYILTD